MTWGTTGSGGPRTRAAAAAALVVLVAGCGAPDPATVPVDGALVPVGQRQTIGEVTGESLAEPGKVLSTADFGGSVVVIDVWGAWCGPCRFEAPELDRVHAETRDDGVEFLGINIRDNDRSLPVDFVADREVGYPSIHDPPGRSMLGLGRYRGVAVPATLVVDRQNRVAAAFTGAVLADELLPRVREVAAER